MAVGPRGPASCLTRSIGRRLDAFDRQEAREERDGSPAATSSHQQPAKPFFILVNLHFLFCFVCLVLLLSFTGAEERSEQAVPMLEEETCFRITAVECVCGLVAKCWLRRGRERGGRRSSLSTPRRGVRVWWTLRTERVTLMGERPRREPFSPTYPMSRGVYHEQ